MRSEDEIRREHHRLLCEAARMRLAGRPQDQADYERDAEMLTWVLGEEDE